MISVGDIVVGTVAACESFGAVIVHDDVRYFVPLHELTWRKLSHSSDVLTVGQPCEIIIDRTDDSRTGGPLASVRRVNPEQNPWFAPSLFSVGTQFSGPVTTQYGYGLFVAHPRGVEGLLHSDDIPYGFALAIGDVIAVEITECNLEAGQIRLHSLARRSVVVQVTQLLRIWCQRACESRSKSYVDCEVEFGLSNALVA